MNYKNHYEKLITRARDRIIEGYLENHHILPKCMGGTNDKINLVKLTAREHFIAHVLLVKIHPKAYKLIFAVNAMSCFKENRNCSKNRMYGWLRKRHASAVSKISSTSQQGCKNSQYGTCWITDMERGISKRIKKTELNLYTRNGWVRGRNKRKLKCVFCTTLFIPLDREKRCVNCEGKTKTYKNGLKRQPNVFTGREKELIKLYEENNHSLNKTLKMMGYCAKGDYFYKAKEILKI